MKVRKFLLGLATFAMALTISSTGVANAAGQIEGGNIYRVKNVTKNIDFTDPVTADACDVLMYKVRIHNPGPDVLTNVNVKATLSNVAATSNTSLLTVSSTSAYPTGVSDTAVVNLSSSRSINYLAGSTQLLDANGGVMRSLPDGIIGSGVNIGNVGVSINEKRFVQFQAKVACPEPPVDVCPNIDGVQTIVPSGMIKDANGNCVTPPVDVCPNISGVQTTVPAGLIKDANGNCVEPPKDVCPNVDGVQTTVPNNLVKDKDGNCVTPPNKDVCPNITGVQETVPAGLIKDANGNCVEPPKDVCPNISGVQTTVPSGMVKDANGNCVTPATPVTPTILPDTGAGSIVAAFVAATGLGSLGFNLITRRRGV